jgi:cytochrome P450
MAMTSEQSAGKRIQSVRTSGAWFGQSLELLRDPYRALARWALCPERVSTFNLLGQTFVLVADPELIRGVLSKHINRYQKGTFAYSGFKPILGNGLILAEGDLWTQQRSILARAFRAELLHHVVKIANEAVERLMVRLDRIEGTGTPVDFSPEFRGLTLEVIGQAVLSLPPEVSNEVFPKLYLPLVEEANLRAFLPFLRFRPTPGNLKFQRALDQLDKFLTELIERRHREGNKLERKDILDRIMGGSQAETGQALDAAGISQLRDEVKTFLLAGHETTSAMLTWALFELSRSPTVMARVIEEAQAAFAGTPSPEAIVKGLKYTEAVLREALRRNTGVPAISREAVEDDVIGPYRVKKGDKIVVAVDAVHQDPKLWPNPERFEPERFLSPLPHPYAFLAFLAGPRSCIGEHFALIEAKIVLARLVKRYRFLRAPGTEGRRSYNVPLTPSPGMSLYVESHA